MKKITILKKLQCALETFAWGAPSSLLLSVQDTVFLPACGHGVGRTLGDADPHLQEMAIAFTT